MPTSSASQSAGTKKGTTFPRSLVTFGIPWVILYRSIDYVIFRIENHAAVRYPWGFSILLDIPIALIAATLWWLFMCRLMRR